MILLVILCTGKSHKKKTYLISNKEIAELGSDIKMTSNPSYDTIKKQECQYNNPTHTEVPQCSFKQDTIKLDTNPSYGEIQECETLFYDYVNPPLCEDVTIQPNPSYSSNSRKISEDQNGYVKTDVCRSQSAEETDYLKLIGSREKGDGNGVDNVRITPNPSYESVSKGIIMEDNPSYVATK